MRVGGEVRLETKGEGEWDGKLGPEEREDGRGHVGGQ